VDRASEPFIGARLDAKCCTLMNPGKKAATPRGDGFLKMLEKKENKEQTPRLRGFLNCVCFRLLKLSNRLLSCEPVRRLLGKTLLPVQRTTRLILNNACLKKVSFFLQIDHF
jgi:hypothetical protein